MGMLVAVMMVMMRSLAMIVVMMVGVMGVRMTVRVSVLPMRMGVRMRVISGVVIVSVDIEFPPRDVLPLIAPEMGVEFVTQSQCGKCFLKDGFLDAQVS